ncbi:MAG: hypothetical protein AB1589_09910 [Cyanobacteriota bacterium]
MFEQFRVHYPKGSLITELLTINHGKYIVRCLVQVEGTTLVTGLAAAQTVELAEDQARSRALTVLGIYPTTATVEKETSLVNREVPQPLTQTPIISTSFSSERLEQTPSTRFSEPSIVQDTLHFSSLEQKNEGFAEHGVTTALDTDEMTFSDSDEVSLEVPTSSQDVEAPIWMAQKKSSSVQLDDAPVTTSTHNQIETHPNEMTTPDTPIDFSDIIARTNVELKRLGWTTQQGKDYLLQTYGKRSRQLLTDGELLDFLHHLEVQPTPE